MRLRPLLWLIVSVSCFLAAAYFWRLGDRWAAEKQPAPAQATNVIQPATPESNSGNQPGAQAPLRLLTDRDTLMAALRPTPAAQPNATNSSSRRDLRLRNTTQPVKELVRNPAAVLLENAFVDTANGRSLDIPSHLRSTADPGTYIVQSGTALDTQFRQQMTQAGFEIVGYIPNNAYLARGSAAAAQKMRSWPQTLSVLPYEPYYKLRGPLLQAAVDELTLPDTALLNVLVFGDAREQALEQVRNLGMQVLSEERSPFGPVFRVRPVSGSLPQLASLSGVQQIEPLRARVPANDLSRAALGVSIDTTAPTNYLDLTGEGVVVNLNDTGVDTNHPALLSRVFGPFLLGLNDTNGHGTHVAGIIMGDGAGADSIEAEGSEKPSVAGQFRGIAHKARLLSLPWTAPDPLLQETVARTNILVSNNSWYYLGAREYDLAAASYDAAVRDALPEDPGDQPVLFVFSAGNEGRGRDDGGGGLRDSILSPGTAKNVITVGALEQIRNITNEVVIDGVTNKPWQAETDSSDEVADYSSRGNVGYYLENDLGRFKPDLVAPGSFVVSTRSSQMDTNAIRVESLPQLYTGLTLNPGQSFGEPFFVPTNTVRLSISVLPNRNSPFPFPSIDVYADPVNTPPPGAYSAVNQLIVTDPSPQDTYWNYAISNPTPQAVVFDLLVDVWLTNETAVEFERLNETLAPHYRYESGTSMAAGKVSGMLALIQEFFEQRLNRTNSPALMKALLINGARSAGNLYDFQVTNEINFQGWGLPNLRSSLHGGLADANAPSNSMFYVDQSPTNALATGDSITYNLVLSPAARSQPLRATLVWTDPPGNPAAGLKLVNDLDLVVTNLDNSLTNVLEVYYGNYMLSGTDYTQPYDTNGPPVTDVANNVENVYLNSPLAENYSITVRGTRVNVNAVPSHTNNVVQDFALVISSGDGLITNVMRFSFDRQTSEITPDVTVVTNRLPNSTNYLQGRLERQRIGAHSPVIGTNTLPIPLANSRLTVGVTNQWRFYAFTNQEGFPYMRFRVSTPVNLSVPRIAAREALEDDATREEPDLDLYVSMDFQLTNLFPAAISNALKSYGRLGTETIYLSNAPAGIFYAGVKCEDQMAGEYTFEVTSSREPFALSDDNGNQTLRWLDPEFIPDGTPENPGAMRITLGGGGESILVRRVIVTNVLSHELMGDLEGVLSYEDGTYAVLNNHSPDSAVTNQWYVYDDSEEGDLPWARPSDGPGNLLAFGGKRVSGTWNFTMIDNSFNHVGTNLGISVWLEKQQDMTGGLTGVLQPNRCTRQYVEVGPQVTSLEIDATLISGQGPLGVQVCPVGRPDLCVTSTVVNAGTTITITVDVFSDPPLIPGVYEVRLCNLGVDAARWFLIARLRSEPGLLRTLSYETNALLQLKDDAVTYSSILVAERATITSLDVGMLINHPRISDLAITLISPNGTRVLLTENRGALTDEGLGGIVGVVTNAQGLPVYAVTNLVPIYTNDFERAAIGYYAPGAVFQGWNVLSNYALVLPDYSYLWLSNNILIPGYSSVSNTLPTTNATHYQLQFRATHAPYLVGTVGWWPFDGTAEDIFGGWHGLLGGGGNQSNFYTMFATGKVHQAFYGDAVRAGMMVPAAPELNLGLKRGFTIEGWINPAGFVDTGESVMRDGFENAGHRLGVPAGTVVSGWLVESGDIDLISSSFYPFVVPDTGLNSVDLNGFVPGTISTNFPTVPGTSYVLSFAYARNPAVPGGVGRARVSLTGQPDFDITYSAPNSISNMNWVHTSMVFTASSPLTRLALAGLNPGDGSMFVDTFRVREYDPANVAPLFEWSAPSAISSNDPVQGVQFWLGGTDRTNVAPGALAAVLWTTNGQSFPMLTASNAIINDLWQHVAFSYDATTALGKLYINGQLRTASTLGAPGLVPRTDGNLYFGFHPGTVTNLECFKGGMDEFGLYERALSDCEVSAIHLAGSRGKYGTNVLSCPITNSVQLITDITTTYQYTHGLNWTNGPLWETVTIDFTNPLFTDTNGLGTNLASIIVTPLDPNVALDDFVLSAVTTNLIDGLLNFTENTNRAVVPMKFAPWPYNTAGFQPTLVHSNDFERALPGRYQAGDILPGMPAANGVRDWLVLSGSGTNGFITVVSNSAIDMSATNWVALARGSLQTELPTVPGMRYELSYNVRGPAAVGWWNGEIEPLTQRARDLIGGNHGEFLYDTTDHAQTFVGARSLYFNGYRTNNEASKLELADPENLRLTNALTIEGWIRPIEQTNFSGVEQIFFRGDERSCRDPFFLALDPFSTRSRNLRFHIDDGTNRVCGVEAATTQGNIAVDEWQHIAAVFEPYVEVPIEPFLTNQLRLYINGQLVASNYTGMFPARDLEPGYMAGVAIGNHSRYIYDQAYRGFIDELSVYGRALTEPELLAIHAADRVGKADLTQPAPMSLAKVRLSLNGAEKEIGYGDNSRWTRRTVSFIAERTNTVLTLEGLLPGTLVNDIALHVVPDGLNYLPEETLNQLIGEDAFGTWTLEIWDKRTGATNFNPELVSWNIQFQTRPLVLAPTVYLTHGITYTNSLVARGTQNFIVEVPQWATNVTNVLLFATNRLTGAPVGLDVFMSTNGFPDPLLPPTLLGPGWPATNILSTNTAFLPHIIPGQPYYLTVTNPNPASIAFALGVWFDIMTLTNCELATNFVGPAGIPRYFQFDVPTNDVPPHEVVFWLSGVQTNVTVVLNQHLPLPDLNHHDYISRVNSTNDQIVMLLTNSTPFPIHEGRWYVGVFNSEATNVPFTVQACYRTETNFPNVIQLTNEVPYEATNLLAALPGPPRWVFYEFNITNFVDGVLFELYDMSGDLDLTLQRHLPSAMAPYFAHSFETGLTPEQIVLRTSSDLPDLRGKWYLGVYNNELTNVSYSLRAILPRSGMLTSVLPIQIRITPPIPPRASVIEWNAVVGEVYLVEFTPRLRPPSPWQPVLAPIIATTPTPAVEVFTQTPGVGFYRVTQVGRGEVVTAPLTVQIWSGNQVRLSWSQAFAGYTLQYSYGLTGGWINANLPVTVEGTDYVAYDTIGDVPKFYRLIP